MADENPTLCGCGCGLPAPISQRTHRSKGIIKGQPRRFIVGHFSRTRPCLVSYKKADGQRTHRTRAERALGYPLPVGAVIHHPDEDPTNPNARLVICDSAAYHAFLHARMRVKAAGGNPNLDKICHECKQLLPRSAFGPARRKGDGLNGRCRKCDVARAMMGYQPRPRRSMVGGHNPHAKLYPALTQVIAWLAQHRVTQTQLVAICGVSTWTIRMIVRGKHWTQQGA